MARRGHRLGFRNVAARQGELRGAGPALVILAATALVHAGAIGLFAWSNDYRIVAFDVPVPDESTKSRERKALAAGPLRIAYVDLIELPPDGELVPAVLGAGDEASFEQSHPAPNRDVTLPGDRAASRGGGARGGAETYTGRHDTEELRSQMWNHPERYQTPRHKSGHSTRSPEAIVRQRRPGYAASTDHRRRAKAGHERGNAGTAEGRGSLAMATELNSHRSAHSKEQLLAEPAKQQAARTAGTTRSTPSDALVDRGSAATETHRKGAAADRRNVAGLSHERNPMPFDMSRPSAHGPASGDGVAGRTKGAGVAALGTGSGTAATRAQVPRGPGRPSTRSPLEHPYFRRFYQRLGRFIQFPEELALALEQGEVIVHFTLRADGSVGDISVAKPSGFRQFDRAVIAALRRASPFGPVPAEILRGASAMTVKAPYMFSNPVIQ